MSDATRNDHTLRRLWGCVSVSVPYIKAERSLKELTLKGVLLGVFLSVILGAANTYLGLKVGLTVSASIPAAVVSMAVLRAFRNSNILENNAVQTAASAGESLAAGVLFTIPALLLLGYWTEVHYMETTIVALLGGILGVLFTVPLRRALIVEAELHFPEGVATSEVLKSGAPDATAEAELALGQDEDHPRLNPGVIALILGAVTGLVYKFMQSGMKMWTDTAQFAGKFRGQGIYAFGSDLSPALLGVGYIVGLRIASLVFLGGVIGWAIAIPIFSATAGSTLLNHPDLGTLDWTTLSAGDAAGLIWSTQIRYLGVGAMLVGGLWSLVKLRKPLGQALMQGFSAARSNDFGEGDGTPVEVPRTEREFGIGPTFLGVLGMVFPIFGLYWYVTESIAIAAVMALLMVVTGFLFSAVGAYMAGIVGSSNNPISGVTILTVLASAFTLRFLGIDSTIGPAATILVAAVIACAGAIASDNMQDLKAGHLLGSTPRKQQFMQIVGVSAAALVVAPVLQILHNAYTIGSADLAAPQASLMRFVAEAIFGTGPALPQVLILLGALLALVLIITDELLQKFDAPFGTPVMPVAVGIYLPVGLSAPIFLGGLLAWASASAYNRRAGKESHGRGATWWDTVSTHGNRMGILFSSGLIAGEALVGIALAAIIVSGGDEAIAISDQSLVWPGLLMFGFVLLLLGYLSRRSEFEAKSQI